MGLDRKWQAIPHEWNIFRDAMSDGRFWSFFEFIPTYFERGCRPLRQDDDEEQAFCNALKILMFAHPGIEARYFYPPGRNFDAVHFLLSETRRNGYMNKDADDLGTHAIRGARPLPEPLSDSGYIRYSDPADVLKIAEFLAPITESDLKYNYDPLEMDKSVYKFIADRADETKWYDIWEEFQGMRAVYLKAEEHHECVLAILS